MEPTWNINIFLFRLSRLPLLVQIPFLLSWVDPFAYCKGFGPLPLRLSITTDFACGLYPTFNQQGLYVMTKSKGSINTLKASCERNVKWLHFKGLIKGVLHIIKNQGCIKPLSFMFPKTQDEGCKPSSRVLMPHQHTSDPYARGRSSPCKYEGFFKLLWASTHYDQLVGPSTSSRFLHHVRSFIGFFNHLNHARRPPRVKIHHATYYGVARPSPGVPWHHHSMNDHKMGH